MNHRRVVAEGEVVGAEDGRAHVHRDLDGELRVGRRIARRHADEDLGRRRGRRDDHERDEQGREKLLDGVVHSAGILLGP